jgi:hypothetical protein
MPAWQPATLRAAGSAEESISRRQKSQPFLITIGHLP